MSGESFFIDTPSAIVLLSIHTLVWEGPRKYIMVIRFIDVTPVTYQILRPKLQRPPWHSSRRTNSPNLIPTGGTKQQCGCNRPNLKAAWHKICVTWFFTSCLKLPTLLYYVYLNMHVCIQMFTSFMMYVYRHLSIEIFYWMWVNYNNRSWSHLVKHKDEEFRLVKPLDEAIGWAPVLHKNMHQRKPL